MSVTRRLGINSPDEYKELIPRPFPHSAPAEQAVLGAIILDNSLAQQAIDYGLTGEDFYIRANMFVWLAIMALAEKGSEINPILIGEWLRAEGNLEQTGGIAFISELTYGLPHFTNIATYAKVLKDHAGMRALIRMTNHITGMAFEGEDEAGQIWAYAEQLILEGASKYSPLRGHKKARQRDYVWVGEDKAALREAIENAHSGKASGLPLGVPKLDGMLDGGGLQPQGFYIIAAKPKAGKTSFALGAAHNIARRYAAQGERRSVAVISMEMRRLALTMRLFSAYTQIPYIDMTRAGFRGPEYEVAMASIDLFFEGLPLIITDAVYTISDMWRVNERAVFGKTQAGLIVVDYIQLAEVRKAQGGTVEDRYQAVTTVSRELKHMAQEFNVPVVGVSSINRLAPREGRASELYDLRESGQLEYDAEGVGFLENLDWRPKMTEEEKAQLNARNTWNIGFNLAAQRNGPTGVVPLKFIRPYMHFMTVENYERMLQGQRGPEPDFGETKVVRRPPDEIPF